MAPPKHPENFVSYRASTVGLASIVSDLERVETALDRSTTAVDRANLKSQATLLRIQAGVTEGDVHFDKRRFDQALSSYQDAGKLILTLIDPQMGSKRAPRTWLDTPAIAQSLQQVSSGLLGNLVPAAMTAPPVALTKPITLAYQELGADPQTTLEAVEDVNADALAFADLASTAVEQGRWAEADSLYQQALAKITGTTPAEREARAALLLNQGAVQTQRSQPDAAIARLGEAEALFRSLNDDLGAAQALHNTRARAPPRRQGEGSDRFAGKGALARRQREPARSAGAGDDPRRAGADPADGSCRSHHPLTSHWHRQRRRVAESLPVAFRRRRSAGIRDRRRPRDSRSDARRRHEAGRHARPRRRADRPARLRPRHRRPPAEVQAGAECLGE